MISKGVYRALFCMGALCSVAIMCQPVQACAVCFGDPDSELVKGAKAGALVLAAIAYLVLVSFAGVVGFWAFKARRLSAGLHDA